MKNVFKISGLDCANCARELEEEILKINGVESATVDFMAQKVVVDCDGETLNKVKCTCNHFEEVKVVEELPVGNAEGCANCAEKGSEKIKVKGLCCANCARELEEELGKIEGLSASVDFMASAITIKAESAEARDKALYTITHFEDVKIIDEQPAKKSVLREHMYTIIRIVVAAVLFIPALVLELTGMTESVLAAKISAYVLFSLAYIAAGIKVLINTVKNLAKGKIFDENFLMTIASLGAIGLGIATGDGFAEGVAVMLLYETGELLQSVAVGSSRRSITALMGLKSETATLLNGESQIVVKPEELKAGDKIIIKAGEKVPVDCRILRGESALDVKSLNGEPLPREVKEGDEILSGGINISGVITAEVIREYKDSAVAKILELVENSTAKKSKPEKFISKFAKYYTPAVCIAALVLAALVPTVICAVNSLFIWDTYRDWIYRALNFLVISCPCALVISVPLSYFGGIGRCAKFGILVKGSTCLDSLATAKVAAFDKTGTLTEGSFRVVGYSSERALNLAASAEKFSSHPIAAAFSEFNGAANVDGAEEIAGRGVKCLVNGKRILCGNAKLLNEYGVSFEEHKGAEVIIYVAEDNNFVGWIEIDDEIKSGAAEAVAQLKRSGISRTEMLTGDSYERANSVAAKVGLDGFKANLLPDGKLEAATAMKSEGGLIYVGDGINDAPVMAAADCAVSMGKVGSDAAIEASDIVLVSDNLSNLAKGRRIARGTRSIVKQNIIGSLLVKFAIMVLSIVIGLVPIVIGGVTVTKFPLIISVVADVGVMLIAVLNAMRTALIK